MKTNADPSVLEDASPSPRRSLMAALLGFFIITLDALVVSVALPAIRDTFNSGIIGLQWVMDGYTLPFAALLLLAGTLSDRIGARKAFGAGLLVFVASSVACAFSPTIRILIAARIAKGAGAALMTPASLALIGEAYPDPKEKARAIGLWAVGGAIASSSGPLLGGALTIISWRLIFLINLPVGVLALWLLAGVQQSSRQETPFDWIGQAVALVMLTTLVYGLIEAGELGLTNLNVLTSLFMAGTSGIAFFVLQRRSKYPMVPFDLFQSRSSALPVAIGFTFMIGFYGMVFLMSLFLQEERGLSAFETGLAFLPVTCFSIFMPVLAARMGERFGIWVPIVTGQAAMAAGLLALSTAADIASVPFLVALMIPVGLGAGTAMPSATSLLLNSVPPNRAGTASGVLNSSRQIGGATAIAAFGALIAGVGYDSGLQLSLIIAGVLLVITMLASVQLRNSTR